MPEKNYYKVTISCEYEKEYYVAAGTAKEAEEFVKGNFKPNSIHELDFDYFSKSLDEYSESDRKWQIFDKAIPYDAETGEKINENVGVIINRLLLRLQLEKKQKEFEEKNQEKMF